MLRRNLHHKPSINKPTNNVDERRTRADDSTRGERNGGEWHTGASPMAASLHVGPMTAIGRGFCARIFVSCAAAVARVHPSSTETYNFRESA